MIKIQVRLYALVEGPISIVLSNHRPELPALMALNRCSILLSTLVPEKGLHDDFCIKVNEAFYPKNLTPWCTLNTTNRSRCICITTWRIAKPRNISQKISLPCTYHVERYLIVANLGVLWALCNINHFFGLWTLLLQTYEKTLKTVFSFYPLIVINFYYLRCKKSITGGYAFS